MFLVIITSTESPCFSGGHYVDGESMFWVIIMSMENPCFRWYLRRRRVHVLGGNYVDGESTFSVIIINRNQFVSFSFNITVSF